IRKLLHQNAELSWEEVKTTAIIREEIEKTGFILNEIPGIKTGGYVDLIKEKGLPFLALRADIDALPVKDNMALEYASKNPNVSHACGHDFHSAAGLAVVKLFKQISSGINYNLRVIFQPAEEPIPSGALKCIETDVIKDVKAIFAIHVEPKLPVGAVSFTKGWVNAQSHSIKMSFKGKGGHSARVNQNNHLIYTVSKFIQEAGAFIDSKNNPEIPSVLAFTKIMAGDGYNVLPEELELTATLRTASAETIGVFSDFVKQYALFLKENHKVDMIVSIKSGAPPVVISEEIYESMFEIYSIFLKNELKLEQYRSMGGDDFGWFLTKLPGALIRIGIADAAHKTGLHQPGFDANEESLYNSLLLIINLFMQWK
ncbi:MAG: amidohydrolase, partial [Calditrichia bacterium]|nr:amidohydrolase [Calditrichia bacterium]